MEFRLVYRGPLPPRSDRNKRVREKHDIRCALHPQLATLWAQHPGLNEQLSHRIEHLALSLKGYRFVWLVEAALCELDILFLRPGLPGLVHSGDIDNRIKTLLDALRVPKTPDELPTDATPGEHEDPFHCLLKDDASITRLNVTTDTLLEKMASPEDVILLLHVTTKLSAGYDWLIEV